MKRRRSKERTRWRWTFDDLFVVVPMKTITNTVSTRVSWHSPSHSIWIKKASPAFQEDDASTRKMISASDNAGASSSLSSSEQQENEEMTAYETAFTSQSDLSNLDRRIWVITTASLPWRTGTAVNPLMRALALTRGRPKHHVTLFIPWLTDAKARTALYGKTNCFDSSQEQEAWIRDFCRTRAKSPEEEANLRIQFWDGIYHNGFGSIFPAVDICSLIPKEEADVAILEEPEHLNWFRVPATASEKDELGWAHKFQYVVGILHTNYDSYVKKYGMGTSFITAPALGALTSLVVKAYCHRVIRLSDALPSLVSRKEVTANVHGVRAEFLDPPVAGGDDKKNNSNANEDDKEDGEVDREEGQGANDDNFAAVYYVGKLIWAKGFEDVLELQERYRAATGNYFEMDIYGGGNDEKAIKRAFYGRHGRYHRTASSTSGTSDSSSAENNQLAAKIFDRDESLLSLLRERESQSNDSEDQASPDQQQQEGEEEKKEDNKERSASPIAPMEVLSDLSQKTLGTGAETAGAAMQLIESAMQHGFGAFTNREGDKRDEDETEAKVTDNTDNKLGQKKPFFLGPRRAAFKWRKDPVPARFLGVKDHIVVRDIPNQRIFLNMSTSEVLCTTSAEALAMGKFVVLPKHPSNEFFLQFPNCLAYEGMDDCVAKLLFALANQPTPLSTEEAYMLSWEGATERLFQAAGITRRNAAKTAQFEVEDLKAARFHIKTARRSQFVSNLFNGKILSGIRQSNKK